MDDGSSMAHSSSDGTQSAATTVLSEVMDINEFEFSSDALILADDRLIITHVNEAAIKFFKYDEKDDLVGAPVIVLIPEDSEHHRKHSSYIARYKTKGQKRLIGATRVLPAVCGDDTRKNIEITLTTKRIGNGAGKSVFLAKFEDATGLISHIEHVPLPIIVCDSSLNVSSINSKALEFLERPRGSVIGKDISYLVPTKIRRRGGDFLRKFVSGFRDDQTAEGTGGGREMKEAVEGTANGIMELGTGTQVQISATIKVDPSSIASHYFITLSIGGGGGGQASSDAATSSTQGKKPSLHSPATSLSEPAGAKRGGHADKDGMARTDTTVSAALTSAPPDGFIEELNTDIEAEDDDVLRNINDEFTSHFLNMN